MHYFGYCTFQQGLVLGKITVNFMVLIKLVKLHKNGVYFSTADPYRADYVKELKYRANHISHCGCETNFNAIVVECEWILMVCFR